MIRKLTSTVLGLAFGLVATGAMAQAGFTQDMMPPAGANVAHELFGGDAVELEFGEEGFDPKALLIFGGGASIAIGTEFSVTYTLANGTFAESVSFRDFQWGRYGVDLNGADDEPADDGDADNGLETADNCGRLEFTALPGEVRIERDGGRKDTNEVEFSVRILGMAGATQTDPLTDITVQSAALERSESKLDPADCTVLSDQTVTTGFVNGYEATAQTRKIVFDLPNVNATGLAADPDGDGPRTGTSLVVSVEIEQGISTGTPIEEAVLMGHMCGSTVVAKAPATGGCPVVGAVKVIDAITASGGSGSISLDPDDERAKLVNPATGKVLDPHQIKLSTVEVDADFTRGARDQDGDPIDADHGFTNDLAGSLAIKVSSQGFRDGDVVYIDENGNKKPDGREAFEIDGNEAMDSLPLADGTYDVLYMPNGKDPLKHRTMFRTSANTEFADVNNRTVGTNPRAPGVASLMLHGLTGEPAKAYAIAPLTSTDITNVRVTCEATSMACNVFLDCTDKDGMNTFGETRLEVAAGATVRWSQMDIAGAIGLDDGWEGRLRCDVLSNQSISVQVLTRAAGVLVNNSAINTGG